MVDSKDGLEKLKRFEKHADAAMAALPIFNGSAQDALTVLHQLAFSGIRGRQLSGDDDGSKGEGLIPRFSHLLFFLERLPPRPIGESRPDLATVLAQAAGDDGSQMRELVAYGEFAEIMPQIHRGYFDVVAETESRFHLSFRDEAFADGEAKDIILSQLAAVFTIERRSPMSRELIPIIENLPNFAPNVLENYIANNAPRFLKDLAEADLITNARVRHIFGFDRECFLVIRAVVLAFAELCEKLATTIYGLVLEEKLPERSMYEQLEWVSVGLQVDWLVPFWATLANVPVEHVERFLEFYSIDFREELPSHRGGDGFFPPFARFRDILSFSPLLVRTFLQVRNAIFAFSKSNKEVFDSFVSHDLEPVLLKQAIELFHRGGNWITKEDIKFPGGQIDLLVASPEDDRVLLIQAKGNLPPHGPRLTRRLADRVHEGLAQIKKFEALTEEVQRQVIEQALGRKIGKVVVQQALMTRSCFGTPEVFADSFPYIRLTAPLLSLALEYHRDASLPTTVAGLVNAVTVTEEKVFREACYHWETGTITVAGGSLQVPMLRWNQRSVDMLRYKCWLSSMLPPQD